MNSDNVTYLLPKLQHTELKDDSGGARPGRARSNDLAERLSPCLPTWLPPWLSFFLSKEINVRRGEHIRNDAVSVKLPTAKICNQSQVSINVIFFHHCLGNKDCN